MILRFNKIVTVLLMVLVISAGTVVTNIVYAQDNEPLTEGMRDMLKSEAFNVGLLLQSDATFTLQDDNFLGGNGFGLGATRLGFSGNLDEGFNYKMVLELRNSPSVIDAAIGYTSSEQLAILAGIQKPDIGLDLQPGPGKTDFINRARLIGAILSNREVGVSAQGRFDQFDYSVAIYNGTGRSLTNDDEFMYAAKGAFTIETDDGGRFYIGVNGAINGSERSINGLTTDGDRLIYGAFADYRSDSWFGAFEVLLTSFDSVQLPEEETITGAYITLGNNVTEKDQLLARWDYIGYEQLQDVDSSLFILGWNHQATSVISFQVNALAQFEENEEYFGLAGNFQYEF